MRTAQLETSEVTLYYTVRGAGRMQLILQGGAGNADGSEALASELADHFTVVTYDRRGLSRSKPMRAEGYEIAAHAGDAARLITAISSEPVFVFGSRAATPVTFFGPREPRRRSANCFGESAIKSFWRKTLVLRSGPCWLGGCIA